MLASFVIGFVLLSMAQLFRSNHKLNRGLHSQFQLEETLGLARFLLQKPGACKAIFAGKEFDSSPTAPQPDREIREFSLNFPENPSLVLAADGQKLNPQLQVSDLFVTNLQPTELEEFLGALSLRTENQVGYGGRELLRSLSVVFLTEPTGLGTWKRVVDCFIPGYRGTAGVPNGPPPINDEVVTTPLLPTPGAGVNCNSAAENAGKLYLIYIKSPYALLITPKKVYTADVTCPEGTKVKTGGAECGAGFSFANEVASFLTGGGMGGKAPGFLIASRPSDNQKSWHVACCIEGTPTSQINAFATCEPE